MKLEEMTWTRKRFGEVFSYVLIVTGALLASFSVACVLLPNDAIDCGTAGIAIILSKMTGLNHALCVAGVFLPFLAVGTIILGRTFGIKALVGSAVYIVGLEIFEKVPFELNTEHYLAVAFGGAILGVGHSLILRSGGCIDGSEIFAKVLVKKIFAKTGKHFSMVYILVGFNACVFLAAFFLINRNTALMSLLVYVVATAVINHFTGHFEPIKPVPIIAQNKGSFSTVSTIDEALP